MNSKPRKNVQYIEEGEGNPILVDGHFWSVRYGKYICKCFSCRRHFLSKRPHAVTCSPACRKERSRMIGGYGYERGKSLS